MGRASCMNRATRHRCESSPPRREPRPNQPRPMDTTIRTAGRPTGGTSSSQQLAGGETGWDIVRFAPNVKSQPQIVVKTPAAEGSAGTAPSPDGRWLAYVSDTTGRAELWVQSFPGPGSPVRVSSRGGAEPVWARNGRELYYLEGNKLMAVAVTRRVGIQFQAARAPLRVSVSAQPPASVVRRWSRRAVPRHQGVEAFHPRPLLSFPTGRRRRASSR